MSLTIMPCDCCGFRVSLII